MSKRETSSAAAKSGAHPGVADLQGVWNIVPTPFTDTGEIDRDSIRTLVDFVIASGVNGMTILGVNGEASKISDAERALVIEDTIAHVAGRLPVCVGITAGSTRWALANGRAAVAAGAHSVMLAPTPGSRQDDDSILRQYATLAEALDVPIVVQDHPAFSNVRMSVGLLARICGLSPALQVIKLEAAPTPPKVAQLAKAIPGVTILGGLGGNMLLEELRHGAAGTMTGFAFPEALVDIVTRWRSGDTEGATASFYHFCPLIRFEFQEPLGIPIRKLVYQRRGAIRSAHARLPAAELDAATIADLDDLLRRIDFKR
jgi:4-hydroxy-tetrahydrodipicolinate synthase